MTPRRLATWLTIAVLAGCGGSESLLRDTLDPQTAVTITSSSAPLVFYRDDSARAAYARDFVYAGPIRVNTMGSYRYFLWLGVWSAIPDAPPSAHRDGFETVTLFADGEPLQLELAGWNPVAIGASAGVYLKPVASAADAYYEVTIDQLRLLAASRDLRLLAAGGGSYELWNDQGAAFGALQAFVDQAGY